jgi:DNA polymerase-3 subunit epsilon
MLRQVQRIEWDVHPTMLQAEVAEARAIARLKPPFNRAGKTSGDWYLKVIAEGVRPRLAAARAIRGDGALYIGPIGSMRATKELIDALRDALPLARCTDPRRCGDCAFAQMRRCPGRDLHAQRRAVLQAARCLTVDPGPVVTRLEERMRMLAAGERYEEAAEVRDRGVAVERTAWRTARVASLVSAGRVVLRAEGTSLTISEGVLKTEDASLPSTPSHTERSREAAVIVSWLERNAARVELLDSERPWAMPARVRPPVTFKPPRGRR